MTRAPSPRGRPGPRHAARFALAATLLAAPAWANPFLAACGDTSMPADRLATFCARALEAGGLDRAQETAAAINLGAALLDLGRPGPAEEAYARAAVADPNSALAFEGRARAREALGRVREAAADWDRAAALAPRDLTLRAGRGAFLLRQGDPARALADFDAVLAVRSDDVAAAHNRGLALEALGRDAEAVAAFGRIIAARPDDAGAWLARARVKARRDPGAALGDFGEAARRAPQWSAPWFERGLALEALGRAEEANRDYRRAWELGHRGDYLTEKILAIGQ